jgi:hypothetical protein
MRNNDQLLNNGNRLYEDKSYLLVWTKLFGLSITALTSYYVYNKQKKTVVKLNSTEKTYLMRVSYYLTKDFGISPRAVLDKTTLFKDLCLAVSDRGHPTWQRFFEEKAKDKAKGYAQQAKRKSS